MSLNRYATNSDKTQGEIVKALRKAGWQVWVIKRPVDLLCWRLGVGFRLLECKSPANKRGDPKIDKRQVEQNDFIELTGVPRVTSPEQALAALGVST